MANLEPGIHIPTTPPNPKSQLPKLEDVDDVELCAVVRSKAETPLGRAAFAELYERHREAVTAQAYTMVADWALAEELAAETFTRVLRALSSGNGPQESVLGYLLVALRSEVGRAAQIDSKTVAVEPDAIADFFEPTPDFVHEFSERDQIATAFSSLPEDARYLLWVVEIEGLGTDEAAALLNMTPGALRVALHRARKSLATSYLQQYVEIADPACLPFARQLASLTRRSLGKRETAAVEKHLLLCDDCAAQVERLRTIAKQLRLWVGPVVIGGAVGEVAVGSGMESAANAASLVPPATRGVGAGAVSNARKLIASLGLVAGIGLVIWGASLLLHLNPTPEPGVPLPPDVEAIPTPVDEQEEPPADSDIAKPSPGATSLPDPARPAVESDDATPNWYLRE